MKNRIFAILLVLALVCSPCPMPAAAAETYGYEVVVTPNPAAIGTEVTLTVRLTDYTPAKSPIRGFQIDITDVDDVLHNAVCTSLAADKEDLLSDTAQYQPARDLVRHLYAKMNGTMACSVTDLLEVKFTIPEAYTEVGILSLPLRILLQNQAGDELTYRDTIEITYGPEGQLPDAPETSGFPVRGLPANAAAEVAGKTCRTTADGTLWLEESNHQIVTIYGYETSAAKDPEGVTAHEQYPAHMQVWHLTYKEAAREYQAEHIAELDDFLTYEGTSIRFSTNPAVKSGIRVITSVPTDKREALIRGQLLEGSLAGYRLAEYGTLFQRADRPGDFVYGNETVHSSYAYFQGEDRQFRSTEDEIWFTGALVDLDLELCAEELRIRPYLILEKDSSQIVIHGGALQRSVGYVAYQNRDFDGSPAAVEYIWNIIQAVYGNMVSKEDI